MFKKLPQTTKFFIFVLLCVIFLMAAYQKLLNTPRFQKLALDTAQEIFNIDLNWENLKFNAATGNFQGKDLSFTLPKSQTRVHLKHFEMSVDPFRLLFKRLKLTEIKAEGLSVKSSQEFKKSKKKLDAAEIKNLISKIHIENGLLSDILIDTPGLYLKIKTMKITSNTPVLLYDTGVTLEFEDIHFKSKKFDLFAEKLGTTGSFDLLITDNNSIFPALKANINATKILYAFNNTPTPWNPVLAWDPSMTELIFEKYNGKIPENRVFGTIDSINLESMDLQPGEFTLSKSFIRAMNGEISLSGRLGKTIGSTFFRIDTPKPITMALLPLGKANARSVFETLDLFIDISGNFNGIFENDLKAQIDIQAHKNLVNPEINQLAISGTAFLKNGILNTKELKAQLGGGSLKADASVNFKDKTIDSAFNIVGMDTLTAIRFFSNIDVPGNANAKGTLKGNLKEPELQLSLQSPGFQYESLHFGIFKGLLTIKDKHLSLNGSSLLQGQGSGKINLDIKEVFKSALREVNLKTNLNNLPAGALLDNDQLTGQVSGFFNFYKLKGDFEGKGLVDASNLSWYKLKASKVKIPMSVDDKRFIINSFTINWDNAPVTQVNTPSYFHLHPGGFTLEGKLLPQTKISGSYDKQDPDHILLSIEAKDENLKFFSSYFPFEVKEIKGSGEFVIDYDFKKPLDSEIDGTVSSFNLITEEKKLTLSSKSRISFNDQKIYFQNTSLNLGQGKIGLNGRLSLKNDSDLKIKGEVDIEQLTDLNAWLSEGTGLVKSDLTWKNSITDPKIEGSIDLNDSTIILRNLPGEFMNTKGKISLTGDKLQFTKLSTSYDDSPLYLDGWISLNEDNTKITASNLRIQGDEIPLFDADSWRILADLNLELRGSSQGNIKLVGDLQIVEGLYYKDYSLSQFVIKPVSSLTDDEPYPELVKDIGFDLRVKTAGEFLIQNNLAEMALATDMHLLGTLDNPTATGNINILEGEIRAIGLNFKDATGFATFNKNQPMNPLVEFSASYDIQDYEIRTKIKGYSDNLSMVLESTPALSQTDIVSLIAYGRTPDQLSRLDRNIFSTTAIASQIVGILQRPLSKATKLDIVKLESEYDRQQNVASRFSIGKKLSDRFSLAFTTDLSLDETYRGFAVEYQIYEGLLFKASKDTGSRYRYDLTYRFEIY